MVGLGLLDDLEVLGLRSSHSDLSHIDVAVGLGNHAEVFLADLLTGGGKLGNSASGGSLRGLSTGVGVHLGIDNDDVDIFAGSEDVVETAESDIIAPAVTTEDPLGLLDHELFELEEGFAGIAAAFLHHRNELVGDFLGLEGVLAVGDPLVEEGLHLVGAAGALKAFAHETLDAVAHLAGSGGHTETELGVVFEEGVGPSGTEAAAVVAAVGSSRSRTTIDGGASGGIGDHHLLTEELGDAFQVRSLTATCASAGEFEQRLSELAVLDRGELVDEVVLIGDHLLAVIPVLSLMQLALYINAFISSSSINKYSLTTASLFFSSNELMLSLSASAIALHSLKLYSIRYFSALLL